jgi:nitrate reductase NapE component
VRLLPWVSMSVVGLVGTFAAFHEFLAELQAISRKLGPDADWPWRERFHLLPWVFAVVVFGSVAVVGDIGVMVWIVRHIF